MNIGNTIKRSSSPWFTILLGAASLLIVAAVVSSPESALQASLQAMKLWWNIVFPALLPFLVLVEIINAYGWSHGVGVLLEPIMRRIFKLPGKGGSVLITGMLAGFPAGAQVSSEMVKQGDITPTEAGRLAAMSHFCNPMTILIVIGTGLLHQPAAGYFLLAIHWISGILAAWTYSLRRSNAKPEQPGSENLSSSRTSKEQNKKESLLLQAIKATTEARTRDGRSFGKLLGESVTRSVQTLMMTGGYIIIFAVIVTLLSQHLLSGVPSFLAASLLEFHLGALAISEGAFPSSTIQLAILSGMLAWSGISAHLQSLSGLKSSISTKWSKFALKRLVHTVYACCLTLIFWKPVNDITTSVLPAFGAVPQETLRNEQHFNLWSGLHTLIQWQIVTCIVLIGIFTMISRIIDRR